MKHYFSRITADQWQKKNNLEKAAHKLALEMDRRILHQEQVPAFKREFTEKMKALNSEYKRCKPLVFSIDERETREGDIMIWCDGVFNMSLFLVVK